MAACRPSELVRVSVGPAAKITIGRLMRAIFGWLPGPSQAERLAACPGEPGGCAENVHQHGHGQLSRKSVLLAGMIGR
jgi:hypothetical protein